MSAQLPLQSREGRYGPCFSQPACPLKPTPEVHVGIPAHQHVRTPLLLAEPCCIHHRKSRMNFLQILAFHSTFNIHSCQARNKEQHQLIYIEWIQFILHYECQF